MSEVVANWTDDAREIGNRIGPLCGCGQEFCAHRYGRIAVLGARSAPKRDWPPAKGSRLDSHNWVDIKGAALGWSKERSDGGTI